MPTLNQQVSMSWLPGQLVGVVKVSSDPPALVRAFSSLVIWARSMEFSAWEPTHFKAKQRKEYTSQAPAVRQQFNKF